MSTQPIGGSLPQMGGSWRWIGLSLGVVVVVGAAFLFVLWFIFRVEVNADEVLILTKKTGRPIPTSVDDIFVDQVVLYPELLARLAEMDGEPLPAAGLERTAALRRIAGRYKGIQHDVLLEGRYFPNPYTYKRVKQPFVTISQHEVGVLIRQFGKPLSAEKSVATEPDERGPLAEVLNPGRHAVNTLAYTVRKFDALQIPEGHVGVVTLLSGTDPVEKNTYTVAPGEKGVQREVLRPGLEYYNPYLQRIDIVDIRNRTYHMLGGDAIHFPSNDSFTITIEGTIEWSIDPQRVAEVTVAYGDEEDIINKIILPYARSISRIEGSKLQAREFISGKTRTAFQVRLLEQLRLACRVRGVVIHSALVREILPPPEIASLISQREQADQDIERSRNQIAEAEAEARLVEQQEMQTRNAALGDARRDTVSMTKEAEQREVIAVTDASRQFEVAKLQLESARKQATALRARGEADAKVVLFDYQARAEPLGSAVAAFGGGEIYAQHFFLQKVAPAIRSILTNTDGPFAEIFDALQSFTPVTPGSHAPPGAAPLVKGGGQ